MRIKSEPLPEKRPKRRLAAGGPAAPADDTLPLSSGLYSHCGTSAGTHTAARRGGRRLEPQRGHGTDKENR